jgi:hypothetical protein
MEAQGLGASEIAKAPKIGRASVYRGAGSRVIQPALALNGVNTPALFEIASGVSDQ